MCDTSGDIARGLSGSSTISGPSGLGDPYRSFQVVKTTSMGLGAPQGFAVMIHPTGGSSDTPSRAYHTSKLWWPKQRYFLPPSFTLFTGGNPDSHKHDLHEERKVGKAKYRGWEGLVGLKIAIEIIAQDEGIDLVNQIPQSNNARKALIKRKGGPREYEMRLGNESDGTSEVLIWKGTKSAVKLVGDSAPLCNGNLKLIKPDQPGKILAIWKNRTDYAILGALHVLEKFDEGRTGQLEEVMLSCLSIVFAERLSARGWLGGMANS